MPAEPLINPAEYADKPLLYGREEIAKFVPQAHEFALLDGVLEVDGDAWSGVGFYEAREDSYWARGHIPGRPLMPGVLMIEASAQLATFVYQREVAKGEGKFMGFGGMDGARFRGTIVPPARLLLACKVEKKSARASKWYMQGFVGEKMVYEGRILSVTL